jgi:outer membrane protein OmpA-like peptidoglycan-associated protein
VQPGRRAGRRCWSTLLLLLPVLGMPGLAWAQSAFSLERFTPTPAGDRFLGVPSPYVAGGLAFHGGLLTDYAYRPLVLRAPPADTRALVSHQAVLHANITLALQRRLLLNLDLPALALQKGETTPALHGADVGDVRAGARVRLLGENATPFQLGLGGYLWLPTATGRTTGDGAVRGMPYLALGGLVGPLVWSGMLGAEFRPAGRYLGAVQEGISLDAGAALGYLLDEPRRLQLGLESALSFVAADPSSRNLNAELLFDARYRFADRFEAALGAGPGLSRGLGTATLRAGLLLAYVPVADLFPARTPTPDNAAVAADSLLYRSRRLASLPAAPPDARCCTEGTTQSTTRALVTHGAQVSESASESAPAILFDVGSTELTPDSERVIHALADYLISHPEVRQVELCGYADLHGTVESNERLGARRADAVKQALVRHSVAATRLVSKGYGATAPVASSTTAEGLHRNRRVVVRIAAPVPSTAAP